MKKLKIFSVFCVAFLMGGLFAQPALAQTGDCNGDGVTDGGDVVFLGNYLFIGGDPPPIPFDCDVDGTPGINVGDLDQLLGFLYSPHCDLMPYTGLPPSFSNIKFIFPVITPLPGPEPLIGTLDIIDNPDTDLMGMVITFSYQHQAGHVGVDLNSVDFTGSIVPAEWQTGSAIDNVNNKACLWLYANNSDDPPLNAGTTGPIATLSFTRTDNPQGYATFLSPTVFPPTHSPMLITDYCADDTPPAERMLIPRYIMGRNGDCNCDGEVNVGDNVYLINYLFFGASPPCIW